MIEIALVGVPNSGKSTFFKAATLKGVKIASYPFTTLDPNEGLGYVSVECPCKSFGMKCNKCINGIRFVPIKLWDVAGLVPDAHKGKGKGNAFLDDIMQAHGLIHVVDASGRTDSEGLECEGFDPAENIEMLEKEIDYWILGIIKRERKGSLEKRLSGLRIKEDEIKLAKEQFNIREENLHAISDDVLLEFVSFLRKKSKPIVIAANKIDAKGSEENIKKMREKFPDYKIIETSAEIELALREASKDGIIKYIPGQRNFEIIKEPEGKKKKALEFIKAFLEKKSTGVQEVLNKIVFDVLDMIVVYPVADPQKMTDKRGNILPDALLLKKGSTALDLAYAIHEDIGKKFIAAVDARIKKNISASQELKNGDIISIRSGR